MTASAEHYDAIVVLGAARSGTRLVRDLIGAAATTRTIGYDVNYVWRWGNESNPDDVLPSDSISDHQIAAIRRKLWTLARPKESARTTLVEKSVSNVLRIPFVVRVLPRARYVYVIRDGRDVVESAMRSWRRPSSMRDLFPKVRTFPWLRSGRYAMKYLRGVATRTVRRDHSLRTWGPVYPGMYDDARSLPLSEVCARQWLACVAAFDRDRDVLPNRVIVRYEELVGDPTNSAARLADALVLPHNDLIRWADRHVVGSRVGQHRELSPADRELVNEVLGAKLSEWDFVSDG